MYVGGEQVPADKRVGEAPQAPHRPAKAPACRLPSRAQRPKCCSHRSSGDPGSGRAESHASPHSAEGEHLGSGDILIAYSDGVTEPENDFGEFGESQLVEVVRRHRHLSLEAISEQVIQTLRSWIGAQEQPDDVTLVLARQR